MPRQSSVTREKVFKACAAVKAVVVDVGDVTVERVYKELGRRGGTELVQAYIREWRERERSKEDNRYLPGHPENFSERVRQLAIAAWDDCLAIVRSEVEEERRQIQGELENGRASLERARQETALQIREAELRTTAAETALAGARVEAQQQSERIHAQATELTSLREALAAANAKVTSLEGELTRTRQDAEDRRLDMQAQIERIEEAYRGLERKSLEDIEDARSETRRVRSELEKRLASQTETAERQDNENQSRITELAAALASAQAESAQHKRQAEQFESECRNSVDMLSVARAELARINGRVTAVEEHRKAETDRADKLAQEIKQLMERIASTAVQPKEKKW